MSNMPETETIFWVPAAKLVQKQITSWMILAHPGDEACRASAWMGRVEERRKPVARIGIPCKRRGLRSAGIVHGAVSLYWSIQA